MFCAVSHHLFQLMSERQKEKNVEAFHIRQLRTADLHAPDSTPTLYLQGCTGSLEVLEAANS